MILKKNLIFKQILTQLKVSFKGYICIYKELSSNLTTMNFNKALPVLTACVFLNFMRLFWQSFVAVKMKAWMHAYLKSGGGGKRRIKRRKENNQFGIKFIPKPKSAFFFWLWKKTCREVEGQAKRRQYCVGTVTHHHLFWHAQGRLLSVEHAN